MIENYYIDKNTGRILGANEILKEMYDKTHLIFDDCDILPPRYEFLYEYTKEKNKEIKMKTNLEIIEIGIKKLEDTHKHVLDNPEAQDLIDETILILCELKERENHKPQNKNEKI